VHVNAIAQTFVENVTYFPESYQKTDEFKERIKGSPIGRLAHGWESAALALVLAGDESDFFVGQISRSPVVGSRDKLSERTSGPRLP
jgi:2-keto-3-deoxy-L-fuconate dehydrogenase